MHTSALLTDCMQLAGCNYYNTCMHWVVLQNVTLQKATQESSIPHQSTQQSSVQQPMMQYAMPNKTAGKNQDEEVSM